MIEILLKSLALSLGFTLAAELAFAAILGIRQGKDFLLVALVNILTNPPLVFPAVTLSFLSPHTVNLYVIIPLEIFIALTEGLIYRKRLSFRRLNPFLISLILNSASYLGGLLL